MSNSPDAAPATARGALDVEIPADLDVPWRYESANHVCRLEQQLPDFGTIRFLGYSGRPLRLEMLGHRNLFAQGAVSVERRAPAWHPDFPAAARLGEIRHLGAGTLAASDPLATQALLALYRGFEVTFVRSAGFDAGRLTVSVAGVGLRAHYDEFLRCFEGPLAKSWAAMERTRIGYAAGSAKNDEAALGRLDELASFVLLDTSVSRIYIDGHTDSSGAVRANLRLAQRRAQAVADYLVSRGVSRDLLTVRYHGGRYPVAGNDDADGRARNRRATVRLERNWSVAASEDPLPPPSG